MGIFRLSLSSVSAASVTIFCILAVLCPIQCENSTVRPESRIIGGEEATEGEFLHAVYVNLLTSHDRAPEFCGGSILSADYILLAAHCVDKFDPTKILAVVGKHDIKDLNPSDYYPTAQVIIHPCWDKLHRNKRGLFLNDIAIIKLAKPLPLDDGRNMKAIKIDNERNLAIDGTVKQVIGWGRTHPTDPKGEKSEKLKKAGLAVNTTECKASLEPNLTPEGQICTLNKSASTCSGDSGGALLCDDGTGTNTSVVCGIVSFGAPTQPPCQSFTVFTRVYHYRNWIEAVVGGKEYSVQGCLGGEVFILKSESQSEAKIDTEAMSSGCLSYLPNHVICGICLTLILISWGKKIFLNF